MKIFLFICLAVGWASADKLDRSYLPPPGSKFSGGSPGDIQVPLEFPKLNYSTGRPQAENGVPEIELGINRRPLPVGTAQSSTQRPEGSTYFPKTTTSYAITQTTTFAPADYEELDQSSGYLNATGAQQTGLPQYPQQSEQNYQQRQPIRGQLPSQGSNYNQYQQGQKFQPTSAPYGSTTRRPELFNTPNARAYLPPAPSSIYKGQTPTGQLSKDQEYFGYPFGQPEGPKYQDGQKFAPTAGPGFIEGGNQQNVFFDNLSTVAPQYQDERYSSTTGPINNQQNFGSRVPTQQNQQRFQETPGYPSSTFSPGLLTTSDGQNVYTDQNIPSSSSLPQYQYGQSLFTPGSNQQGIGSRLPQQNQNRYSGNQNIPFTTAAPQYQEEQQFGTPGLVQQNQFTDNQNVPSTVVPQYQETQRYTTPGTIQEGFVPDQQRFGPQISNLDTQNKYGNQNLPSSTAVPQLQNGQRFTTPEAVQQQQQNQYSVNQNFPSTPASQYQNEQRYPTQGSAEQIGSFAPGQENQNQYPGNQFFPSATTPPQLGIGSPAYTQQNQNQYQGNQNVPSSTTRPQYQNGQFVTPGFVQENQYPGNQIISSTVFPQIQNGQRFTPGLEQGIGSNQVNYRGSQTIIENGNQQYPSSVAPQYQSTLSPIAKPNQGFTPNQPNPQYSGRPGYNEQFPSSTASPTFPQQKYGDDRIQNLPGKGVSYPTTQGTLNTQMSPGYGNQPSSLTGSQIYGSTSSASGYYDQSLTNLVPGSIDSTGTLRQNRPERPNAASDRTATILNYDSVLTPEGYMYSYDTSNAIHVDETGIVGDGTKAKGSFSYIGDDGKTYSIIYSADENGFQPKGDHLPTPPPIPEAIQRVIEQANKDKESGIEDDGLYDEDKYGYMKYDGPLSTLRPRNKTTSLANGADIPNNYKSRFGEKNRNQLNKGQNMSVDEEKDNTEFEDEIQTDENISDHINGNDNDGRLLNKYPIADKDLTNVSDPRKIQNGKINSNANVDSMKRRKPVAGKATIRRPFSSKMKPDDAFDNVSVTNISEDNDDMEISQEYDKESDLVNYRDDPNSRTDFHGINRYLPNPKGSNRFNQTDSKRVLVRPDGTNQKVKATNKSYRIKNRKNQATKDVIPNTGSVTEEEIKDEDRIAVPVRNKFSMKKIEFSKTYQPKPNDNNKSEIYVDEGQKVIEKYASDDELETGDGDISTRPGVYQFDKKIVGKPKRPNVNERTGVSKTNNVKPLVDEETGYEYIPPQKKFESEGAVRFPSRTSATGKPQFPSQRVQTTVRPFMTPNVYKTEENDDSQFDTEGKPFQPGLPTNSQVQKNNEDLQGNDRYSENSYPGMTENGRFDVTIKPTGSFSTTASRRPFGRPQTTAMPGYRDQDTTGQERYDEPDYQGPRKPTNKAIYGVNVPNKEASISDSNAFVSTTPLPNLGYQSFNKNQRPGQYQETNIANDPSYVEMTAPGKDVQKNIPYRQGITNSIGQVPSTTFRPTYTLGDRTLAPSGLIAVDGFGRPISSTSAPYNTTYRPVTQDSRISIENQPDKMGERRPSSRFGVTSAPTKGINGYQGSTSGPSEDFSGPKQPQRFDPDTGYYY